ncbi:MAG: hypothetical protein R3F43_08000 [bacterium]
MDRTHALSDGTMGFLLGGLVLLILMTRWWRRPRQRAAPQAPSGVGAALAYALDGELGHARQLLEARVRPRAAPRPMRCWRCSRCCGPRGVTRAAALVQALLRRQHPWLAAAAVKICLDAGLPSRAAALAERLTVPVDLHVAALVRAGQMGRAGAVLARRGGRKEREPAQLASVLAALALERAREGDERGAKRRLKRAWRLPLTRWPCWPWPRACAAAKPDQARAAARLAERCGGTPRWSWASRMPTGRSRRPVASSPRVPPSRPSGGCAITWTPTRRMTTRGGSTSAGCWTPGSRRTGGRRWPSGPSGWSSPPSSPRRCWPAGTAGSASPSRCFCAPVRPLRHPRAIDPRGAEARRGSRLRRHPGVRPGAAGGLERARPRRALIPSPGSVASPGGRRSRRTWPAAAYPAPTPGGAMS